MTKYNSKIEELAYMAKALQILFQAAPACINCEHWTEATEQCKRFNCRPPAKIIARGCPDWESQIPF